MYIRSLEIENLRGIEAADLRFVFPSRREGDVADTGVVDTPRLRNVNLLLGTNGAGKSTVLAAIALGVLSPVIAQSGYRPRSLIRRRGNTSDIRRARIGVELEIHSQDIGMRSPTSHEPRRTETIVDRRGDVELIKGAGAEDDFWDGMFDDASPAFLLVGYGATRRVETTTAIDEAVRSKARQLRYERVASLFEDHITLRPLASWLPEWQRQNPGRYKQVSNLINRLSNEDVRFTDVLEHGEYLFQVRNTMVPFSALSDGYKAYIGWIGDLLYHVCMGCPKGRKLVDNVGIVLVDEIDLHIHPEWQRKIIPTLATTFPNLQFVFTSHSPLVVGTLERLNIIHVEGGPEGLPVFQSPEDETYGLSADQILRSDVFGLDSTRDPEFKAHLDRLSGQAATGDRAAAMRFMREVALGSGAGTVDEEAGGEEVREPPEWVRRLVALKASD